MLGRPVLLVGGRDVVVGAEAHDLGALVLAARDADDAGAHGLGEQHAVVAQAADADDADRLAGADAVDLERAEDGDAAAQHGRGLGRGEAVGDLDDEVARRAVVGGVAARVDVAVEVRRVVGPHDAVAVVLLARLAVGALAEPAQARVALRAHAHAVADLDAALDLGADLDRDADDLVADGERPGGHALCGSVLVLCTSESGSHSVIGKERKVTSDDDDTTYPAVVEEM